LVSNIKIAITKHFQNHSGSIIPTPKRAESAPRVAAFYVCKYGINKGNIKIDTPFKD